MAILEPWNIAFAVGFVVYVVTRGKFATLTKGNESHDRRVGLQEKVLLPAMLVTGLLFPVLYLFTRCSLSLTMTCRTVCMLAGW